MLSLVSPEHKHLIHTLLWVEPWYVSDPTASLLLVADRSSILQDAATLLMPGYHHKDALSRSFRVDYPTTVKSYQRRRADLFQVEQQPCQQFQSLHVWRVLHTCRGLDGRSQGHCPLEIAPCAISWSSSNIRKPTPTTASIIGRLWKHCLSVLRSG
jgi:hypothetical protein